MSEQMNEQMNEREMGGFGLISRETVAEVNSEVYRLRHEKTGAEVLYMANEDENKVFGIAFRTPQEKSNGVPHIIEHTVLSGSRKYKTKEPFMNLLQSSVATFLNAITYSDKTIFPVASRNDKDFQNLMDVYLDAVFFPNIYDDERLFRQEGWRLQLDDPDGELSYSGVVYNEMRGAFSSPDQVAYDAVNRGLFPDTHYANNSGGEPYTIPELTYEEFKAFHQRYYHPSNARIFLYGKMDLAEKLAYLDAEYLSQFEARDPNSEIKVQAPFAEPHFAKAEYSLASEDAPASEGAPAGEGAPASGGEAANKDYFSWSVALNSFADIKENFMLDVLADALFENQSAPVKLALQKQKWSDDISAYTDQKMQNQLTVTLVNAKPEAKDQYQGLIEDTLAKAASNGIDRKLLEASLNRLEYVLREGGGYTTLGILYFQKALDTWLYGGDPVDALRYEKPLADLRASLDTDVWERFVQEKFIDNPHKLMLHLKAVPGLNDRKDEAVHEALQAQKASMSSTEIAELVEKNRALAEWQETEDSPEALATIPRLALTDISTNLPDPPCEVSVLGSGAGVGAVNAVGAVGAVGSDAAVGAVGSEAGAQDSDVLLQHPIFTSGIHYARFSFPLDHIRQEDFFLVSILSILLGSVDTDQYSYQDLATEVFLETGGISIAPALALHEPDGKILFRMDVQVKSLDSTGRRWPELLTQILRHSHFTDDERILEVLRMQLVNKEQAISQAGDSYARTKLMAGLRPDQAMQDELGGIAFYLKLKDLIANYAERIEGVKGELAALARAIFTRGGVIVSLTTDEAEQPVLRATAEALLRSLPLAGSEEGSVVGPVGGSEGGSVVGRKEPAAREFTPSSVNYGIQVSSNVQYVVKGYDFSQLGYEYNGQMTVLAGFASKTYLHNQIRAQGGAYGTSLSISRDGALLASSYRDPNLTRTLEVYDTLGTWLRDQPLTQEDTLNYVIGTLNRFDPPLNPKNMGVLAYTRYLTGRTKEMAEGSLAEALQSTPDGLKAYASLLDVAMQKNRFCVVGNAKTLEDNRELFDELVRL